METGRLLSVLFLAFLPTAALADPACFGLCSVDCVKPISIPDRWDDFSAPGAVGWSGNGHWDSEKFTDTNGNGVYDAGEPFVDGSSKYTTGAQGPVNGKYDAEYYDPMNTGYVALKDLGLGLSFASSAPTPGQSAYYPVYIPSPIPIGVGDEYSWNWSNCSIPLSIGDQLTVENTNEAAVVGFSLRNYILHDSGASWSDQCHCVMSTLGAASPRLIVFPAHDPRVPVSVGGQFIKITKWIGFFLESADSFGRFTGRFVQIQRTGDNSCSNGGDFIVDCAVAAEPTTWGALKASYR